MAYEHYDADGDVSRYMFHDIEFPTFGDEPDAAAILSVPVEPRSSLPATHVEPPPVPVTHVEPSPADLGNPVLADLGIDVDLDFFPEMNFQPQPPATNAGGDTHQAPVMHLQHQQQQPLAPSPAHGFDGQQAMDAAGRTHLAPVVHLPHQHQQPLAPSPAHGFHSQSIMDAAGSNGAAPSGDHGLFYDPLPDAGPSTDFNFMDLNFNIDDVNIDDVLMWDNYDATRGRGGAGNTAPVDVYANFVRFQDGDMDCSNCHLVREVMHANDNWTVYFLVHTTVVGSFQHAIVDRRYPAGADGHVPGRELLYFDLTNHTDESANDFITSNIEKLKNDTSGQFLDTGYPNFTELARTDMNNHHTTMELNMLQTAMELNMLQTMVSAPTEKAAALPAAQAPPAAPPAAKLPRRVARQAAKAKRNGATSGAVTADITCTAANAASPPAAQPVPAAPPAAELPAAAPRKAKAPCNAATTGTTVNATLLLHLEEFYATANSRPVPRPEVRVILESSQVTQQDGGSATMYPSMEAKKRKRQVTQSTMAPRQILEYLRVTTEETEKEVGILNSFFRNNNKKKKEDETDPISYPLEQVRNIKKKTQRILKKASTTMPSRLPASLVDEIDTIKEEKATAYAEIIQAVEYGRWQYDDGSSGSKKGKLASRK